MPALRQEFYGTLRQMLSITNLPLLTDRFPTTDPHNIPARILRQGVAISAFASLEKYLEARVDSLIQQIPSTAITASSLGDDLREFLSVDAVMGLANRLNFFDRDSRQAYADMQIAALSRYSATPAAYTAFGFSPKGSNVSEADIAKALGAFGIKKPWKRLSEVASEIGSTRLSLKDDYNGLARTRHRSAHQPSSNIPTSDLKSHIETTILIAVSFDCLAQSISTAMASAADFASFETTVGRARLTYRFVDEQVNGQWAERLFNSRRILKRYASESAAVVGALNRTRGPIVILRDIQGIPIGVA